MTVSRMHVRDEGSGRPLVLLHGWSCAGLFFDGQVEALKPTCRCVVPDLPGHGKTGNRLALSIESAADNLQAYLAAEDLREAIVCGWSMGALVAYALIERHGAERVAGVLAIDMAPKVLNAPDWQCGMRSGLDETLNATVLAGIVTGWQTMPAGIARRLFALDAPAPPDLLSLATQRISGEDPNLLQPMWASLTAQDFRALLKTFPVPLHLAVGLNSQLYGPALHRWHQEHVPEFHLHAFFNSGHAPHLEEPEKFNELLRGLCG